MSVARRLRRHWALAAVCALFPFIGAQALDDYSLPGDLPAQRLIGQSTLDYLAGDGERAFERLLGPHDRYYGAILETPLILAERIPGPDWETTATGVIPPRYFLTHLLFLAGGVCCYLLVLRLFNNRRLALLAVGLFLLHPHLYAHSFYNSKDIPFLVAFMASLYLLHRAFRRETLGAFLLCGAGVGLLVNLRIAGLLLFAAVLALRALDLATAGKGEARARALLTGGGFALAAILTYHASLPALWTDPAGRFPEMLGELGSHLTVSLNLFRGELLYSRDGPPPDYVPVWVAITTPPATLLLAAMGAAALAWRAARRPRDILRNGPLRFGLLLVALPAATTVAVVVLGANLSENWRHLYFLYAPLLLLAVFGLHALASSAKGRWPRAGTYALAGAAIVVALVSMVRTHPHLHRSFTLLTDRTTPGRLESMYSIQSGGTSTRDLLAGIARDHPSGTLYFPGSAWRVFPENRERFVFTNDFRSGERNFHQIRSAGRCPTQLASTYVSHYYGSIWECIVDPVAYHEGHLREALATEPLDRSRFDAYRVDDVMVYVRDNCSAEDMGLQFFLRVHPVAATDLRGVYGFGKHDFAFARYGVRIDGDCVVVRYLPDYPIARIETGQYTPEHAEAARRAVADVEPRVRSRFDVWLDEDERMLTWVREECSAADAATRFRLHVYPVDEAVLPAWRAEHGFDNRNFSFEEQGARLPDGACVVTVPLPAYPIANIRTGQFTPGEGSRWDARFAFPLPKVDPSSLAGEPLASSVFDVWLDGDALVYARDGCTEDDTAARFLLHLYPVYEADLPAAVRGRDFENRDFWLWERGGRAGGGRCVAVVPLPDYPVASIRTGQYDEGGERWEARFSLVHERVDAATLAGDPLARSVFGVWLEGGALVYVKDECMEDDMAAQFFIHVHPVDADDLPEARREHGFDNRDFLLWQRGGRDAGGRCVAMTALPDYPIASVRTGQYDASGQLWAVEFAPPE